MVQKAGANQIRHDEYWPSEGLEGGENKCLDYLMFNENIRVLEICTKQDSTTAHQMVLKTVEIRSLVADRCKVASNANHYQVPGDQLVAIMRYRADAERSLFRHFLELERIQAKSIGAPIIPAAVLDVRT